MSISQFYAFPDTITDTNRLRELKSTIFDVAKSVTPVDTGKLVGNWVVDVTPSGAFVSNNTHYAQYVNYGTRFMAPRDMLGSIGRFIESNYDVLFKQNEHSDFWNDLINSDDDQNLTTGDSNLDNIVNQISQAFANSITNQTNTTDVVEFLTTNLRTYIRENNTVRTDSPFNQTLTNIVSRGRNLSPIGNRQGNTLDSGRVTGSDGFTEFFFDLDTNRLLKHIGL